MSELSIINDGLVRLGVPPIASLEESSAQAIGAGNIYPRVRATALADFPWSFATQQTDLSRLTVPEGDRQWAGYEYVYQVPLDAARVLGLESKDSYWISGWRLFTDAKDARMVYVANVEESHWPAWFAQAVALQFAAAAAIMLTDATTRADLMYREAQSAMQRARSLDAQQVPKKVLDLMGIYARRRSNFMAGA
ncbi:MAG: hypothetical protein ACLFWM_10845 [Actinomycetota bacterium]